MPKGQIAIDGIQIELERKRIKNVNFTIYPPDGRVRISAPRWMTEEKLQQVIRAKLPWIKSHRHKMINRKRLPALEYKSGEQHPYLGTYPRLNIIESSGRPQVDLDRDGTLTVLVRYGSSPGERKKVLIEWYRQQLKALIPSIIARWEPILGVEVSEWGVKRMKTRWGSCNTTACRIWLNLELIKYPQSALEYIVVHEMVHLLERRHNKRFYAYMDGFLPEWRQQWEVLKSASDGFAFRFE